MEMKPNLDSFKKYILSLFLLLIFHQFVIAQDDVNNDWDMTRVGLVRQVISNRGRLTGGGTGYPGLLSCEYIPANSNEEHISSAGIWISGITPSGEERVSVGAGRNSPDEMWPTPNEWDSVWVVNKGDTSDIGGVTPDGEEDYYYKNYTALSEQDFVSRYNDYRVLNPTIGGPEEEAHKPLYIDVIQTVHTWSSPVVDDVVLYQFNIIPTRFSLESVYFTVQLRGRVGNVDGDASNDDRTYYFPEQQMLAFEDGPGGSDGTAYASVGYQVFPPDGVAPENLDWSYLWGPGLASHLITGIDEDRYNDVVASGQIMENQQFYRSSTAYFSVGPYDVSLGDTLQMGMALVLGKGLDGLIENANTMLGAEKNDFKFPQSPPPPELQVETSSKQVKLIWEKNSETYQDENRADGSSQPFEGYRVYKSTTSIDGPWTPLAQFDLPDNDYGLNNGLENEYIDFGVLNNIEYYYSVVAFSKPDTVYPWPSVESSIYQNAVEVVPGSGTAKSVGKVAVVPNPYRGDINYNTYNPPWEKPPKGRPWMKQDRRIQFINLPSRCEIKIFSASGDFVEKIEHNSDTKGFEDWNLTSYVDQAVASGLYFFTVKDLNNKEVQTGKFVIIK